MAISKARGLAERIVNELSDGWGEAEELRCVNAVEFILAAEWPGPDSYRRYVAAKVMAAFVEDTEYLFDDNVEHFAKRAWAAADALIETEQSK